MQWGEMHGAGRGLQVYGLNGGVFLPLAGESERVVMRTRDGQMARYECGRMGAPVLAGLP